MKFTANFIKSLHQISRKTDRKSIRLGHLFDIFLRHKQLLGAVNLQSVVYELKFQLFVRTVCIEIFSKRKDKAQPAHDVFARQQVFKPLKFVRIFLAVLCYDRGDETFLRVRKAVV